MSEGGVSERRTLGFWSLLALGINGIVGVGIFFAPAAVAALVPGRAGIWVYALTALALVPIAAAYAMLGGRFDEDGGPYVWARAAFGPTAGFAVGWIAFVSALFSTSAVVAGLSQHAGPLFGITTPFAQRLFAVVCVALLGGTAATGLRPSALVWTAVTLLKLAPLVLLSAVFLGSHASVPAGGSPELGNWARAALVVVFATQGFEIVPVPAGNARGSARAVPLATIASLLVAAALYVLLHASAVASVPALARSEAPLVDAARALSGARGAALVALGTNVSALGIAFGMFAMTPRYLAALGNDSGLGTWIAVEGRNHVPERALLVTVAVVVVFVLSGRLMQLFALSSVAVLAQYGMSVASLVALARKRERGLGLRHLWPAPLALGVVVLVAQAARPGELAVAFGVLLSGGALLALRRRGLG